MENSKLALRLRAAYEGTITLSDNWKELVGQELKLGIGIGEYQGQKRNEVKNYYTRNTRIAEPDQVEEKISKKAEKPKKKSSPQKKESEEESFDSEEEINIEDIPF